MPIQHCWLATDYHISCPATNAHESNIQPDVPRRLSYVSILPLNQLDLSVYLFTLQTYLVIKIHQTKPDVTKSEIYSR